MTRNKTLLLPSSAGKAGAGCHGNAQLLPRWCCLMISVMSGSEITAGSDESLQPRRQAAWDGRQLCPGACCCVQVSLKHTQGCDWKDFQQRMKSPPFTFVSPLDRPSRSDQKPGSRGVFQRRCFSYLWLASPLVRVG